jgi:hypothetical protein
MEWMNFTASAQEGVKGYALVGVNNGSNFDTL